MTRIDWAEPAVDDRDRALEEALSIGLDQAEALLNAVLHANHFLAQTPLAGSPLFDRIRRKWRLGQLPYAMIYRVEADRLYILRLVHLRSDWHSLL